MRHWLQKLGVRPLVIIVPLLALLVACGTAAPPADPVPPVADPGAPPVTEATPAPVAPPVTAPTVDRLVYAVAGVIETNRYWNYGRPDNHQNDPYLETLLDLDPEDGSFIPRLATDWEMVPDSAGRAWAFTLRQGVQFHGGHGEVTPADVEFSRSLHEAEDASATFSSVWKGSTLEVGDNNQITFHLATANPDMPYTASRSGDLRVMSKAYFDQTGLAGIDQHPIGTGSYQYVDRRVGEYVRFQRFDDHWGHQPAFRELELRIVPESSTRAALLLSGDAHMAPLPLDVQRHALSQGMKVIEARIATDWTSIYFGGLYFTPGDPDFDPDVPYTDIRVRQALNVALDRDEMFRTTFHSQGTPNVMSNFHPLNEGWDPGWPDLFQELYGYNPALAEELLQEAGYGPGQLNVTLLCFSGSTAGGLELCELAEVAALYWEAAGINVTQQEWEWDRVRSGFRAKTIHCCMWTNSISLRPVGQWMLTGWWSGGSSHYYENEYIDSLYEKMVTTFELEAREEVMRDLGTHLIENYAEIPLFYGAPQVVVNPNVVADWVVPGAGAGRFTHFHTIVPAQ